MMLMFTTSLNAQENPKSLVKCAKTCEGVVGTCIPCSYRNACERTLSKSTERAKAVLRLEGQVDLLKAQKKALVAQNKALEAKAKDLERQSWLFGGFGIAAGLLVGFFVFEIVQPGGNP